MSSGFSDDVGWYLVTQLVTHVFSDNMDNERSFVQEVFDSKDRSTMATAVMWGLFKTHSIVEDYFYSNIKHHPSITSEYTKFLVTSRGE